MNKNKNYNENGKDNKPAVLPGEDVALPPLAGVSGVTSLQTRRVVPACPTLPSPLEGPFVPRVGSLSVNTLLGWGCKAAPRCGSTLSPAEAGLTLAVQCLAAGEPYS